MAPPQSSSRMQVLPGTRLRLEAMWEVGEWWLNASPQAFLD